MLNLTPTKIVLALIIIIGFLKFTANEAVEQQAAATAVELQARQQYEERVKEHQASKVRKYADLNSQRENYQIISKISGYLSRIKNQVIQYERKHDAWPEDMTDLGLNSEKAADGRYIKSIKIDDGDIYAFLSQKYGDNKIVSINHVEGPDVYFPWVCATNLEVREKTKIAGAVCTQKASISFNGRYIQ